VRVTAWVFCYSSVSAIAGLELVVELYHHYLLLRSVCIGDMSRRENWPYRVRAFGRDFDGTFTATVVLGAAFRRALLRLMRMHDPAVEGCDR
jgi:hypothetical protein